MKRLCSLLIGLSVLLSSTSAHALTMTPISQHYVQPILDRVDNGMGNLPGGSASNYNFIFFDWLLRISTAFLELVDTDLRIVEYQRNVYKISPCLHLDLLILEQKLEDVRTETRNAFKDRRIYDIVRLQSMARFLNDRYRHLIRGARDIHYEDPRFNWYYIFDTLTWCCPYETDPATCIEQDRVSCLASNGLAFKTAEDCGAHPVCEEPPFLPPKERVCPFHSDYLPPTVMGYGCDLAALDAVSSGGHPPIQAERDAIAAFESDRDAFLNSISYIASITQQIFAAVGRPPPNLSTFLAVLSRTHRTREGCSYTDEMYNPPATEFDPPSQWPEGAAKWELRGPFFLTSDEIFLVRGLYDQLLWWGRIRDQADYLTLPTEYPPGTTERTDAETREQNMGMIKKIFRSIVRSYFGLWNIEQAGRETKPVIQAGDTQQQILLLADPLRGTMIEFYTLASQRNRGIRSFTTKLGFFLRRTCVFRPCNKMIDRMLKINFEDACFPYVSGTYKGNPAHHETCKGAAGVGESF